MTSRKPVLLVVDDKPNMLRLMSKVMKRDATVLTARNGAEALRHLVTEQVHGVLCDLKMPDMSGLDVLRATKRLRPDSEFVLMTAYATIGTAVEALKLGAFDYVTKPFEPEAVRGVLLVALARASLNDPESSPDLEVLPGLASRCRELRDVAAGAERASGRHRRVLILGESGTGKGTLARALHRVGPHPEEPFFHLKCEGSSPESVELDLFGSESPEGVRSGMLDATRGVVWIDEVAALRPSIQTRLAEALESRSTVRIGASGGRGPHEFTALVVCTSRHDVARMVRAGTFRGALAQGLGEALVMPPLRRRVPDIELLAYQFLRDYVSITGRNRIRGIQRLALDAMTRYDWPGNITQLRSTIERAAAAATNSELELDDLPFEVRGYFGVGGELGTWSDAVNAGRVEVGRRYLEAVLKRFQGRISDAASYAGVERESFYRLLRKHGLDPEAFRSAD
ncbi:MAG: response regulator [Polyangiaceae bacterium]